MPNIKYKSLINSRTYGRIGNGTKKNSNYRATQLLMTQTTQCVPKNPCSAQLRNALASGRRAKSSRLPVTAGIRMVSEQGLKNKKMRKCYNTIK